MSEHESSYTNDCTNTRRCVTGDAEVQALRAALAEAQRERDALICGITDLLHEISGDDYLAGSSLPLPALAAVVRRQVAALAEVGLRAALGRPAPDGEPHSAT